MIACKQKRSFKRKSCYTATLYKTEPTRAVRTTKSIVRSEKTDTNAKIQDMILFDANTRDTILKLFTDAVL